jgi:alpha-L-rhamnosidase
VVERAAAPRIEWAEAIHDGPLGRIVSSWRIAGGRFHLDVTVPPGSTASVELPDGTRHAQPVGTTSYTCDIATTAPR